MTAQLSLFESGDRTGAWSVRTSRRARRLSVRVYPGGRVEIVVPPGASSRTVQRFIGAHRQWIDDRIRDVGALVGADDQLPSYVDLPAVDRRYSIDYLQRTGTPRVTAIAENHLLLRGPLQDREAMKTALRRWLSNLAMSLLGEQLLALAGEIQLPFKRLQIRRQRTRWGSCSASGTISLNVCLLFIEPAVVRYLMIHELSHTRQMNHSARFWALVESHEPNYRQLDRALLRGWRQVPWWMFG